MKLGLGTVQFGMNYGISNQYGKTSLAEIKAVLQLAQESGISIIDTAPSYGDSESVLGMALANHNNFRIITKTPVYRKERFDSSDANNLKVVFFESVKNLRQSKLYGLLVHNADNLLMKGGEILFNAMRELKENKLIEKIGVSVYSGDQIDRLLEKYTFDLIQIPINVFDQRLINNGSLVKLKEQGIEIHARSIFLQGLLLMDLESLNPFFDQIKPSLITYKEYLHAQGLTTIEGAISFIKQISEIDCVIIGVNDSEQLKMNIKSFNKSYDNFSFEDFKEFSLKEPAYLNPSLWRLN